MTNVAANTTRLTSDLFTLVDSETRTYPVDGQAMLFAEDALNLLTLGPDATVDRVLVFDVPEPQQGLRFRIEPANATSAAAAHYVEL